MNLENQLEIRNGYAYWRPSGSLTPVLLIAMFKQTSELSRQYGSMPVFLDTRSFSVPGLRTMDRFHISVEIAKFWDLSMKIAVFGTPGHDIIFDDFGVIAARNCGINIASFESEALAVTWLVGSEQPASMPEFVGRSFRFELA